MDSTRQGFLNTFRELIQDGRVPKIYDDIIEIIYDYKNEIILLAPLFS